MMDTFLSAVSKRHTMGRLLLLAMVEQSLNIGQIMCTSLYIWHHIIKLGAIPVREESSATRTDQRCRLRRQSLLHLNPPRRGEGGHDGRCDAQSADDGIAATGPPERAHQG